MTELLDRAVRAARDLPPEVQDEIARMMLARASPDDEEPIYVLSEEELASMALSRDQASRGEYASDDEMRAIWEKHVL